MKNPPSLYVATLCVIVTLVLSASPTSVAAVEVTVPKLQKFFELSCNKCHGPSKQEGEVRLDQMNLASPTAADVELLKRISEQLALDQMPPQDLQQPNRAAVEIVIAWIENKVGAAGEYRFSASEKLKRPGYGNYVDHQTLFTMPAERKAATMARIWRLDVDSFITKARQWTGNSKLFADGRSNIKPVSFPYQGPAHTFLDDAGVHAFDKSTTEMLLLETESLVNLYMKRPWEAVQKSAKGDDSKTLALAFAQLTGRPANADELTELVFLHEKAERELGNAAADRIAVQAIMLRPEVLFRSELGAGEPDRFGRRYLSPAELADSLGYAVDVSGPDKALMAAVTKCNPNDRVAMAEIIQPYLKRDAMQNRLLRFAQEYFEYPNANEVFKDADRNDYHPSRLVDDADKFVLRILDEDRDVLQQWLTSNHYYVHGTYNFTGPQRARIKWNNGYKDYHRNYNLSKEAIGEEPFWIDMPTGERAGILTHPAWLLAFSDNEKNQAIQRGRWVTTKLLGGFVSDAPVEVDARLPDDESMTLREKMHVTRADQCISCHKKMDPTGLPFEQYDLFGKWRTEENAKPVVTTGSYWGKEVKDPVSYVRSLAEEPKVRQVFLRHVFRFFLGRNETLDDAPTLIDMDATYLKTDGSLKETVLTLLTSDSFLYRIR
jgi:mono/diheme cytochrome c family protein